MNYTLLKQLIEQTEAFERDTPAANGQTMADFATWLVNQQVLTPAHKGGSLPATTDSADIYISILTAFLYRYTRLYSKKVLDKTLLSTLDDFTYLIMLLEDPVAPTKTELIDRNIHEKTTGIEVLRRLLSNGLVEQFDDLNDRRSKRLKLTDRGREEISALIPSMSQVATLIGGHLTPDEKAQLVHLLTKLHLFHNPIFLKERNIPIGKLIEHVNSPKI